MKALRSFKICIFFNQLCLGLSVRGTRNFDFLQRDLCFPSQTWTTSSFHTVHQVTFESKNILVLGLTGTGSSKWKAGCHRNLNYSVCQHYLKSHVCVMFLFAS